MGVKTHQSFAFDNYDPNKNRFDPALMSKYNRANGNGSEGYETVQAKPGQKMQVNIQMNNLTAVSITFELWYYLNSYTRVRNATFAADAGGNYSYIPQNSYEGIQNVAAGTDETVGFNSIGNLVIRGAGPTPGPADAVATLSCKEIAYASFFEASAITPFIILWIRMTVTTEPQFDETLVWKSKSYSGGVSENPVSPRAWVKPTDFKDFIADIQASFDIGIDRGIQLNVLTLQNVRLAMFINFWTSQVLSN